MRSLYEGLQERVRSLKTPPIEVWRNKYSDRDYSVRIETDEYTCICPKTGLPDFAKIRVKYVPDKRCIELKSFKLYLVSFRDVGIFHEHATNRILDDLVKACKPRYMAIEMEYRIRGGIKTVTNAEYQRKGYRAK
ncbi:MAG: NADPH-dependent 7-cyano-7-deazaguanine reductase QueF [Candidatus Omnitrophica bacterium]|nr:NADPH-dependent 7-cyano-7-deazaguanine reductase QueF [Candidatus Omnitrophota bacterium]